MKRLAVFAITGCLAFCSVLLAQGRPAWWVVSSFEPTSSDVAGLPVSELDSGWQFASALNENDLPESAFERGETLAEHGVAFEVALDLDDDGRTERAIVGVYSDAGDREGRFLVILETADGIGWSKRSLFKQAGSAAFSALFVERGYLYWTFCLECDSLCRVITSEEPWALECVNAGPVESSWIQPPNNRLELTTAAAIG